MIRHAVSERVAMSLAGHKTRSVFDRYNVVSAGDPEEGCRTARRVHRDNSVTGRDIRARAKLAKLLVSFLRDR